MGSPHELLLAGEVRVSDLPDARFDFGAPPPPPQQRPTLEELRRRLAAMEPEGLDQGVGGLVGDPEEGADFGARHGRGAEGAEVDGEAPSQTAALNQHLAASFKASLDRVGAAYCPMLTQAAAMGSAASRPGEGEDMD